MTVLHVAERAPAPGSIPAATGAEGREAGSAAAIFLHAGWRSCGTWLWERLRDSQTVHAFYEPLHEDLTRLDRVAISGFSPDSWGSGHGPGAPYFAEFAGLLQQNGRGVAGYAQRFAFDNFFTAADHSDPELEAYIANLLRHAWSQNRLPVLKFARSQGRVAWLERQFPDACHAVVLRDPWSQWLSARAQLERDKNRYFVLAPFVILARNARDPLLAAAIAHLGVKLPPDLGGGLHITRDVCWHHVKQLSWAERYRGFLALWAAGGVASLSGNAMVIDTEALATDPAHRMAVEDAMQGASGLPLALRPRPAIRSDEMAAQNTDAASAAAAALEFLAAHRERLATDRAQLVETKLIAAAAGAKAGPIGARLPGPAAYASAVAYLAATRLLYPLRRAHFHVDQWVRK
jgi:hypothetical protein